MKRLLFIALLLSPSVAYGQPWATGLSRAGWSTVWTSKLDRNGPATSTSLPSGFPSPAIIWWGPSPLTNYGSGGGTFTESGATTAANSPYCPSGNFTDLTNTTNCLEAREFDGGDYYELSNATGDINSTHLSACAVFRADGAAASNYEIAGKRDDADDEGWSLRYVGVSAYDSFYIETDAATANRTTGGTGQGYWTVICGTAAAGGNIYVYNNGTISAATAYPAGTATSATAFRVGTSSAGATQFDGAVLAVYVWPGTTLTQTQVRQFTQYWQGVLPTGDYVADTSTLYGRMCQWMGATASKIVCFADDHPLIGGVISPGLTGAGSGGGMLLLNRVTNSLLQSRDPSATWAVTGTLLGATSTSNSPFLDGANFPVTLLEDNDAGNVEYMAQGIDMTALAAGNKITVVVYARSGSATKGFDIRFYEQTGGACTAAQTDFDATEITTTWKTIVYTYTITDGDCESFVIYTGPVSGSGAAHDFADAAETGDMYAIYQVFLGNGGSYANTGTPPVYVGTTTAASSSGDTFLQWLNNTNAAVLQDAAANGAKAQITYTPADTFTASTPLAYMFYVHNGAYATYERMSIAAGAAGAVTWRTSAGASVSTIAAPTWTAGTSTTFLETIEWGADVYKLYQDNVLGDTDSAAESPPANIDSLDIGYSAAGQNGAGAWVKNFVYKRRK